MSYKSRPKRATTLSGSRVSDSTRQHSSLKEAVQDVDYEVDKILAKQMSIDGNVAYLVKWKGWQGEPTWEPESNCQCPQKINEFDKRFEKKRSSKSRSEVKTRNSSANFDSDTDVESVSILGIDDLSETRNQSASSEHSKSLRKPTRAITGPRHTRRCL